MAKYIHYTFMLALLYLLQLQVYAQSVELRFQHASTEQGLLQNTILSLGQCSEGYIWFGTQSGLSRYDGYNFVNFTNTSTDSTSISNNLISCIFRDKQDNLWIGTEKGLNLYNPLAQNFKRYQKDANNKNSLNHDRITSLCDAEKGAIWIGTSTGLDLMQINSGQISHFLLKDFPNMQSDEITALFKDNEGMIWVGTNKGLSFFNPSSQIFTQVDLQKGMEDQVTITAIIEYPAGNICIGTKGMGAFKFNKSTLKLSAIPKLESNTSFENAKFVTSFAATKDALWITTENGLFEYKASYNQTFRFVNESTSPASLSSNSLLSILIDHSGVMWVGNLMTGVDKTMSLNYNFTRIAKTSDNPNSLINNYVNALTTDGIDNIWVGTLEGLTRLQVSTNTYTSYTANGGSNSLTDSKIWSLKNTSEFGVWVGSQSGISIYFYRTNDFRQLYLEPKDKNHPSNRVISIEEDSKKNIWVGTYHGLYKINPFTYEVKAYVHDPNNPNSISHNRVWFVLEDSIHNFWIGTPGGLSYLNAKTDEIVRHESGNQEGQLMNNIIPRACKASDGRIWFANGAGITLYKGNGKFENFPITINGVQVSGFSIIEASDKSLWLGTNIGLVRFDPKTKLYKVYTSKEGLQVEYNAAIVSLQNGDIYAGGVDGITKYNPQNIFNNQTPPILHFNNLYILNQEIGINKVFDGRIILDKALRYTQEIVLTHNDYNFSIDFVGLHYIAPEKITYKYKLEGLDTAWFTVNAQNRKAIYTNLAQGTYTFKLKAANNDGVWTPNEISLRIIIKPPYWKTWWFRLSAIMGILTLATAAIYFRVRSLQKQKEELEILVRNRTEELLNANTILEEQQAELMVKQEEIITQKETMEFQKNEIEKQNSELLKLSVIASETDNAIMLLNNNGDFEWCNDGFTRLYGYTLDEFSEKYSNNLLKASSNPQIKTHFKRCVNERISVMYETLMPTADGTSLYVQTTLTPLTNNENQVTQIIAIDSDITRIKEAEMEIVNQKNKLELQNSLIEGSIKYAQTIQQTILPEPSLIEQSFSHFLIFKPRDIVSGDFYWFSHDANDPYIFAAAIDCTGHGVPGAFMSLIGYKLMSEIINVRLIRDPAQILFEIELGIIKALQQKNKEVADGMDMCICRLEKLNLNETKVVFAGAKRPLIYFNSADANMITITGDRYGIGGCKRNPEQISFTNHEILLQNGKDTIYLTTDGLIDQNDIGRKRYGTARLTEVLKQIAHLPMDDQKAALETELKKYMGREEQRDDITVLALRM